MTKVGEKIGWLVIVLGGVLQIVWAIGLDFSEGFTDLLWDAIVVVFLFLSIWCLSFAMKSSIPVSTAYTVWIGLGVVGTIVVSAAMGLETIGLTMMVFLGITIVGIIGLKMTPVETKRTE